VWYIIIVPREQENKTQEGHKMTREENILHELNITEQRLKKALLKGNDREIALYTGKQEGLQKMAKMLGYRIEEDFDKAENVDGYWIATYTGLTDVRTN
jgi:hypothetical protein